MKIFFGITLGIFLFSLLLWGVYNVAFRHNTTIPTIKKDSLLIQTNSFPNTFEPSEKILPVITERIVSATAHDRSLYFYSLDEEAFRTSTLDGKDKKTLLSNLPGIPIRIVWSPLKEKVLVHTKKSNGSTFWYVADLKLKTLTELKPEISRVSWDNTGSKIIYQYTDLKTGSKTLNISRPDGSEWKVITELDAKEFFITPIPSSILVSYWSRPNAREKGLFSSVSLSGGDKTILLSNKLGADFLWSPTGDMVLVSSTDEEDPSKIRLFLMNASGGELRSLNNVATLIAKAAWSKNGRALYYALPGSLPESSVLPNDYFEKNLHSQDSFWKIDVATNTTERLVDLKDLTTSYDATDLFLSPNEDMLYFTDRVSQKLFMIEL